MENKKGKKINEDDKRYKLTIVLKAALYDEKQKKFLLLEMSDKNSYFVKNFGSWAFPGGKLDDHESMKEGLSREIKEELGDISFEIITPLNTVKSSYETGKAIYIDYLVKYLGGEITIADEHKKYIWEAAENIEKDSQFENWMKKTIKKAEDFIKKDEYLYGWKRCQADFENYKKRQASNQKDLIAYSNINLITEILPVLDNFYASTEHVPVEQKKDAWVVGIMHIQKQLEKVLEDNDVREIKIKLGDKFDPEIMEAIENKECEPARCKNIIKKVVTKGYKIGDRVIRPARVIVE